jgi:hypothetical protein
MSKKILTTGLKEKTTAPEPSGELGIEQFNLIAQIVEARAPSILFKMTVKLPGCLPVFARLDFHGVLRLFDSATGKLLAEGWSNKPDWVK